MMRFVKAVAFVGVMLFFLLLGSIFAIAAVITRQPVESFTVPLLPLWSRSLLFILGIRVKILGVMEDLIPGTLLVANHQSYLDIPVVGSLFSVVFVAKSEVRRWPLFGTLARLGGTLFVRRSSAASSGGTMQTVKELLIGGRTVLVFPEGTSTGATGVLPFRPLLFQAAAEERRPILPLCIRYETVDGSRLSYQNRDVVCWYGAMDFLPHLWHLLAHSGTVVSVTFNSTIHPIGNESARELAGTAENAVRNTFLPLVS